MKAFSNFINFLAIAALVMQAPLQSHEPTATADVRAGFSQANVSKPSDTLFARFAESFQAQPNYTRKNDIKNAENKLFDGSTEWTVLVFIEGRNNLNSFAKKNIQDMASIGSNHKLNVLVQWYQPHEPVWRYKIEKNKVVTCGMVENTKKGGFADDLIDAMKWAVKDFPAKKYCLILWDHGLGILDPVWNQPSSTNWSSSSMGPVMNIQQSEAYAFSSYNPRTEIVGITKCYNDHRGILFNEIDRTYMNNQEMVRALTAIKNEVLGGKKIDVLGMDACLMSMVEISYQIRNAAHYLVASEEVELAQGWNYGPLLAGMADFVLTPEEVAKSVVVTFEDYFKPRTYLYTQSAINLSRIDPIKENLNHIVALLRSCKQADKVGIRKKIINARRLCQQFSTPTFIDLHSFYNELYRQFETPNLDKYLIKRNRCTHSGEPVEQRSVGNVQNTLSSHISSIKNLLMEGMKMIEAAVVANVNGPHLVRSKGLAIYFPCGKIDASYALTDFAKDCSWIDFLNEILNGN